MSAIEEQFLVVINDLKLTAVPGATPSP